jgi:hypothetical protein
VLSHTVYKPGGVTETSHCCLSSYHNLQVSRLCYVIVACPLTTTSRVSQLHKSMVTKAPSLTHCSIQVFMHQEHKWKTVSKAFQVLAATEDRSNMSLAISRHAVSSIASALPWHSSLQVIDQGLHVARALDTLGFFLSQVHSLLFVHMYSKLSNYKKQEVWWAAFITKYIHLQSPCWPSVPVWQNPPQV